MNIVESIRYFQEHPDKFVKYIIGVEPTPQQELILKTMADFILEAQERKADKQSQLTDIRKIAEYPVLFMVLLKNQYL